MRPLTTTSHFSDRAHHLENSWIKKIDGPSQEEIELRGHARKIEMFQAARTDLNTTLNQPHVVKVNQDKLMEASDQDEEGFDVIEYQHDSYEYVQESLEVKDLRARHSQLTSSNKQDRKPENVDQKRQPAEKEKTKRRREFKSEQNFMTA